MNKFDNAYKTIGEVVKILNLRTKKISRFRILKVHTDRTSVPLIVRRTR